MKIKIAHKYLHTKLCSLQAVCLIAVMLHAQTGIAQQALPAAPLAGHATTGHVQAVSKPVADEEGKTAPDKPGTEGIKIHGHWVIDVKNADGTIAQHRDFQNSLVAGDGLGITSGDQILAGLISGTFVPGGLAIAFIQGDVNSGLDVSSFCNRGSANASAPPRPPGVDCYAFGPTDTPWTLGPVDGFSTHHVVPGLTQMVNFSPHVTIVLTGNYLIPDTLTKIDMVQTYALYCNSGDNVPRDYRLAGASLPFNKGSMSPSSCIADPTGRPNSYTYFGALTSRSLAVPLTNLVAGQYLAVTVTLSFS